MWYRLPSNSIYELFSAGVHQPLHSNTNIHIPGYHNKTPVLRIWSWDTHDNTAVHHTFTMSSRFLIADIQILADTHYLAAYPSSQITETSGTVWRIKDQIKQHLCYIRPLFSSRCCFLTLHHVNQPQHSRQNAASKLFGSVLGTQTEVLAHGDYYENDLTACDFPIVHFSRQPGFDWSAYRDFWMAPMKNLPRRETSWIKSKLQPKAFHPAWIATLLHVWRLEGVCDFIGVVSTNHRFGENYQSHRA